METLVQTAFLLILLLTLPSSVLAAPPDCGGPNNWAANMAYGYLKNAGLVRNDTTDFSKTRVTNLASEKIGKKDLYRQVYKVTFTELSGKELEVITVSDASHEECSMSGVEVFVVSKELGGLNE